MRHIVGRALEVVAHHRFHIGGGDGSTWFDPKRERLTLGTVNPREILVHAVGVTVEESPYAGIAAAERAEIGHGVGFREVKLLVLTFEIALLAGE